MKEIKLLENIQIKLNKLESEIIKYNIDYINMLLDFKKKIQNEINSTTKSSK